MKTISSKKNVNVSPTGGALGAEISGVDLSQPIGKPLALKLQALLYQYQVLIFRNQEISPDDQIRFTRCFGKLDAGPARVLEGTQLPGYSDVFYLSNAPGSPTQSYGADWHSDGLSVFRTPQGFTVLHCLTCPKNAGNTLFANQYQAFEAMSKTLQGVLRKLSWRVPYIPNFSQPMVRVHPRTGRFHLYCSQSATHICGMRSEDSKFLFDLVATYQTHKDYVFRHVWRKDDVVIWENRATLHRRADSIDFATHGLREMHRTTTKGDIVAKAQDFDEFCEDIESQST